MDPFLVTLDSIKRGEGTKVLNAIINDTHLGLEGHGIFTYILDLRLEGGGGQGFGQRNFTARSEGTQHANAFGGQMILSAINLLGVPRWEEVRGKHCRVLANNVCLYAIGHLMEDRWLDPEQMYAKLSRLTGRENP